MSQKIEKYKSMVAWKSADLKASDSTSFLCHFVLIVVSGVTVTVPG